MDDLLTIDPIKMKRKRKEKTMIDDTIHLFFRSASVFVIVGGTRAYAEAGIGVTSPELGGRV